jgi:hypothetical protein
MSHPRDQRHALLETAEYIVGCSPGLSFTIGCSELPAAEAAVPTTDSPRRPRSDGLPDFIIVGAQKGGTTSLQHHLRKHPQIEMAPNLVGRLGSEPHYFTRHREKGLDWYRSLFRVNGLFQGEKSPSYLNKQSCHAAMRQVVPDARLIVILRDPVERAESAYNHDLQLKRAGHPRGVGLGDWQTDLPFQTNFDHYLAGRRASGPIEPGCCINQIENLLRHYPREQVLVLISEDYLAAPLQTLQQVFRFIGVADVTVPFNPHVHVRPREIRIDESTRARLREYYEPFNRRLFELLGREIPQWRGPGSSP